MRAAPTPSLWRRAFAVVALVVSLLLCAAAGRLNTSNAPKGATTQERLAYISSLGWEVTGEERCEEVSLPQRLTGPYDDYLALQREVGFDLSSYAGKTLIRYCYEVTNYPDTSDTVLLDLLVHEGGIVGGDVRSPALDGFIASLAYPAETP